MNSFGNKFKVTIFGESHSPVLGVSLDGIPAGIALNEADFTADLARRKAGAKGTTARKEDDVPILSGGIVNGITTGDTITVSFKNENVRPEDYSQFKNQPRPGHADFTARCKYGDLYRSTGGGIFSGRMTVALVAAGVVAKKILGKNVRINAELVEVGGYTDIEKGIDSIPEGDSVGGLIKCICSGIPAGIGEPFFDSVESMISHLAFSIPGIKGIEFGDGFKVAGMLGSEHNDPIVSADGRTSKNGSGGINGGLTNGNDVVFSVAVKPTSSISLPQQTFNFATGKVETLTVKGRHDKCIALRGPVIVESIAAIAFANMI
ncbi:MAG: chorismate synthase [Bacteroidales bacterium]|nr:chorismate synthase [Bacteroidales bacterium]